MLNDEQNRPPFRPGQGEEERSRTYSKLADFLESNRHILWALAISAALVLFWLLLPVRIQDALLRGLRAQPRVAFMLFVFSLLALSMLWSLGHRLDTWAFTLFNIRGRHPRWLDYFMLGFSQLGNGIAALLLSIFFFSDNQHRMAYVLILGTLTLWWLVELVKAIVRRSRPFLVIAETRIVGWRERGRSFPSGHTSQSFFLVTIIAQHYHLHPGIALALYLVAGGVGITRMYVGAHYPRDVMAGAILGSVWGLLGTLIDNYFIDLRR